MNDPNGLLLDGGVWHLYFQHHPDGVVWGPMSWGHATSPDLVHWTEQPVAIPALPHEHVFSGCAVRDGDRLVAVYTAVDPATQVQTQALATSSDGGSTWNRHPGNPVLDVGSTQWRDPKVFRHGDEWVMVLVRALDHVVEVWRSPDLLDWRRTGETGPYPLPLDEYYWEMPDLVRLPVEGTDRTAWVMLLSVNPGGPAGGSGQAYATGSFDGSTFVPDPGPGDAFGPFSWADHGPDLYAATSFHGVDDAEPPVWIGWMSNWAYADRTPTGPWRGAATLARRLSLRDVDGRLVLVQRAVAGTVGDPTPDPDGPGLVTVDVEVPAGATAGVDVLASADGAQRTRVLVVHPADGVPHLVVDRRSSGEVGFHEAFPVAVRAPLPGVGPAPDGVVRTRVEVVVDTCSVEVFAADGATSVTALVFPDAGSTAVLPVEGAGATSGVVVRPLA